MTREFLLETMTDQNMHQLRCIVEKYNITAWDARILYSYAVDAKTLYYNEIEAHAELGDPA